MAIAEIPFATTWRDTLRTGKVTSADGTRVHYWSIGQGDRAILLPNGLGGRLYAWEPLLDALWRSHRLVTWDYRGLFESETPSSPRRLAIPFHVEDALTILREERIERVVSIGWSMGVQVSLELAALHPERVAGLVLLNGTHGHAFSTGFQPLGSVPGVRKRLHAITSLVRHTGGASAALSRLARLGELPTLALFSLTAGARSPRLRPALRTYMADVLGPSFENYLRLFQELDAHSVYHLLPEIQAPALVVSGGLDLLTPARQSREIAARMPNAELAAIRRASHFALLERPEVCVPKVRAFLADRARW
jgi:pimeloyl-ACP methyl ester carboxylesterase